jgi:hypothetical protein
MNRDVIITPAIKHSQYVVPLCSVAPRRPPHPQGELVDRCLSPVPFQSTVTILMRQQGRLERVKGEYAAFAALRCQSLSVASNIDPSRPSFTRSLPVRSSGSRCSLPDSPIR